jgi:hypothetical protein
MAEGRYKLIVGERVEQAGWCGQVHPNNSHPWNSFATQINCSATPTKMGCLFDILADPTEHVDLALSMPSKAAEIYTKMLAAERHWFNPDRGRPDLRACEIANATGYWQPYLP